MSRAAYADHPIRKTLQDILALQRSPELTALEIAGNEEHAFVRDKVFATAQTFTDFVAERPAELVSLSALTSYDRVFKQILEALQNFHISRKDLYQPGKGE